MKQLIIDPTLGSDVFVTTLEPSDFTGNILLADECIGKKAFDRAVPEHMRTNVEAWGYYSGSDSYGNQWKSFTEDSEPFDMRTAVVGDIVQFARVRKGSRT